MVSQVLSDCRRQFFQILEFLQYKWKWNSYRRCFPTYLEAYPTCLPIWLLLSPHSLSLNCSWIYPFLPSPIATTLVLDSCPNLLRAYPQLPPIFSCFPLIHKSPPSRVFFPLKYTNGFPLLSILSMRAKSLQSCPTLFDPVDWSPWGSSVYGILQAGILEWVTMPFSRASSPPMAQTCISHVSCIGRQILYH